MASSRNCPVAIDSHPFDHPSLAWVPYAVRQAVRTQQIHISACIFECYAADTLVMERSLMSANIPKYPQVR